MLFYFSNKRPFCITISVHFILQLYPTIQFFRCRSELCCKSRCTTIRLHNSHTDCVLECIVGRGLWLFIDDYIYDYFMHAFMQTFDEKTNSNKDEWKSNYRKFREANIPMPHSIQMAYQTLIAGCYVLVSKHPPIRIRVDPPNFLTCYRTNCDGSCMRMFDNQTMWSQPENNDNNPL